MNCNELGKNEIANQVIKIYENNKIKINTKSQKYPILIGSKLISKFHKICDINLIKFKKCLIIIDSNVPKKLVLDLKKNLKNKETFYYFLKLVKKKESKNNRHYIENITKLKFFKTRLFDNCRRWNYWRCRRFCC